MNVDDIIQIPRDEYEKLTYYNHIMFKALEEIVNTVPTKGWPNNHTSIAMKTIKDCEEKSENRF